jgi:hypothetical protein
VICIYQAKKMLSEKDHVTSQEKENLALQRIAEIRRLAVQLNIKQNIASPSLNRNEKIVLLRKELINKSHGVLTEFDITETYNFRLDFEEKTMPELVSTLTKLRKFVLSQIRMARHVNKIQSNTSNTFQSMVGIGNDASDRNINSMNSSSDIIRDFSNYSTPSKSNKQLFGGADNNNNNVPQKHENQVSTLKVKSPFSSAKRTSLVLETNRITTEYSNAGSNSNYNYNNILNKEEEKNNSTTVLGLTKSSPHQIDIDEGETQTNKSHTSPNRSEHRMLLENSIDHRAHNDSVDKIDLRIRQQEMERLRHFRQLAEQQVETKLNTIQNIIDETNHAYRRPFDTNKPNAYNNVEEAEYHIVQNTLSPPPAPPRTPPQRVHQNGMANGTVETYDNLSKNDELNTRFEGHQNPLETSLDALMSLASTPLSKLRQEENEIFAEKSIASSQQRQQLKYKNISNNVCSPTTTNITRYNMNAPDTPNQMPVPIPMNPSTPYAMPSPPMPLRQSTPVLPSSHITTRSAAGRNAVPEIAFQVSAEQASKQKRDLTVPLSGRQQTVAKLDGNGNLNNLQCQESTDFIDPEDDERNGERFNEEEFKLINSQVHFYDSKVKLGDISKVSFYESSGVDSSYGGGDASVHRQSSRVVPDHPQMRHEQQRHANYSNSDNNVATNMHIVRGGETSVYHQRSRVVPDQQVMRNEQHQQHVNFSNSDNSVATNVHISRRGSVSVVQQQHQQATNTRIPLPRSVHVSSNQRNTGDSILRKTNLLLQSSVERKFDSNYYPEASDSVIDDGNANNNTTISNYDMYINDDESNSFLPGSIYKKKRQHNDFGTERKKTNASNKNRNKSINNASTVSLQRPGESFAIAERRVRERLKKKKREGMKKKNDNDVRKARLRKLEEHTKKVREESMALRKAKNKKNGYAALAKKHAADVREEEQKEKAEAARKKTVERLRKKKIELAKKKQIEDAKKKEEEEKKWKIRDEKVKNFKERREERMRQKKMIKERAARNAARPKPQWNSTTSNNNTIGTDNNDVRSHGLQENENTANKDSSRSKQNGGKIRKYSKPRPHELFPKNMQKKKSSGLVPKKIPTVMKMQHHQHVEKKERGRTTKYSDGYGNIQQTHGSSSTSNYKIPSKIPTMVVMAHTNHVSKMKHGNMNNARNGRKNNVVDQTVEEVVAMDDSIMSLEDVEKWIYEQEEYFSKSGINEDSTSETNQGGHGSDGQNTDLIDLNEHVMEKKISGSSSLLKKSLGNSRQFAKKIKSTIIENEEEDDKFLDSLLMDSSGGIGSILSPFKMKDLDL